MSDGREVQNELYNGDCTMNELYDNHAIRTVQQKNSTDAMEQLSKYLAQTVTKYFDVEEHRREFEEWYFRTYNKQYIWKRRGTRNPPQDSADGSSKPNCGSD